MATPRNIVIIGAGIIGSTTAYYLTQHPFFSPTVHSITLLEANAIASGASGKAGGLLAKWAYPRELVELSWRLHAELAAEHAGAERWGYRAVGVGEVGLRGRRVSGQGKEGGDGGVSLQKRKAETTGREVDVDVDLPSTLDFFHPHSVRSYTSMGSTEDTSQVHPHQFTTSMAALAMERGVKLVLGKCEEVLVEGGRVTGVRYTEKGTQEERVLQATDVVVAAGPWSGSPGVWPGMGKGKGKVKIGGLRAHSVVVEPTRPVGAWAVFSRIELPSPDEGEVNGKVKSKKSRRRHVEVVTPEIYTRPDETVYICGEGDTDVPLPDGGTADVQIDSGRCDSILKAVGSVSSVLGQGSVLVRQACYLPVVEGEEHGGPLIGRLGGVEGGWIASGHSCWGIMNGPATGLLMSEYIFERKARSANIEDLDPRRVI